jgi:predicted MFS family arabinose efflux permease
VGTALYGAFALGAPIGSALYDHYGFAAIGIVTIVLPLAAAMLVARRHGVAPHPHERVPLATVLRAVWRPGAALALSGVGFGAITTFVALLFAERGWGPAWLAFSILSAGFVTGRAFFGHLPDRIGGAKVACACVLLEAIVWRAPSFPVALTGVGLSGLGYSLVYPSLGVEAVRRAPERSRGVAMGTYTAFLDLSLGLSSPALGLVASGIGLGNVFLVSTLVVLTALAVAIRMLLRP